MHFKFLSKAIKKLSQFGSNEITEAEMEKIYELTYKYQMLKQEMAMGDYGLPQPLADKAYMEFHKIGPKLEFALDETYDAIIDTYESWIEEHTPNEWAFQNAAWEDVRESLSEKVVYVLEWVFPDEEDAKEFIIDTFDDYFDELEIWEKLDHAGLPRRVEEYYLESLKEEIKIPELSDLSYKQLISFIEDEDLEVELKDKIMDERGSELAEEHAERMMKEHYEDSALGPAVDMKEKLENEWEDADLDDKLLLFQEALTNMHNNGEMAEYILESKDAIGFLHALSEGRGLSTWDNELTRTLGYPPSSRLAPKQEWFTSAMKRISKVVKMLKELCH